MSEILEATINVATVGKGRKQAKVALPTKKGSGEFPLSLATLSKDLAELFKENPDALDGMQIQVERESGQIRKAWQIGQSWQASTQPAPKKANFSQRAGHGSGYWPGKLSQNTQTGGADMAEFENPYNFVPALPRHEIAPELADHAPKGHHRYHEDHWSGRITVQLTSKTPLLIPDTANLSKDPNTKHNTYAMRKSPDGAPLLPSTSIKGMLRSAYEAVTNSRMGVLEKHNAALAYRLDAREGITMVPVRITQSGPESHEVSLLLGKSEIDLSQKGSDFGQPKNGLMYAAWVGAYCHRGTNFAINYANKRHGAHVWAYITKWCHTGRVKFQFWNVEALRDFVGDEPTDTPRFAATGWRNGSRKKVHEGRWVQGWLCITGRNIGSKHHERLFFVNDKRRTAAAYKISLKGKVWGEVEKHWKTLIRNYQEAHSEKDVWKRNDAQRRRTAPPEDYLGHQPGQTAWSTHVFHDGKPRRDNHNPQTDAADLGDGTLCYARLSREQNKYRVIGLYPVMISRDLYDLAPADLLDKSLKPAGDINALSPADRVFGWVRNDSHQENGNKSGLGAFRGQLKIGPVSCDQGSEAIESLPNTDGKPGVPLAILGQPKPQQARFYTAANKEGEPLDVGIEKNQGYANPIQGLRGRKVYPYQKATTEICKYWDLTQRLDQTMKFGNKDVYQEFRRLPDPGHDNRTRDEQNRSITEWVKPERTFTFNIQVTNLSQVELGALLWLLSLPEKHCFRLGYGKPLGFGSVHLAIKSIDLRNGQAKAADYRSLFARGGGGSRITDTKDGPFTEAKNAFKQATGASAANKPFHQVPYIQAFINACKGGDLPVHYPRTGASRTSGKIYEWFVENEKNGKRESLPSLTHSRRCLKY